VRGEKKERERERERERETEEETETETEKARRQRGCFQRHTPNDLLTKLGPISENIYSVTSNSTKF
jgi:hypothetical protein